MMIARVAWRSFLRHKRRSLITASAISFGLALMLISVGLGKDVHDRMADMGIRLGAGHVLVQARGFQDEQTLDYTLANSGEIMAAARGLEHVSVVVPRVRAGGLLSTGEASSAVIVAGVDPALEPQASLLAAPERRLRGQYIRATGEHEFVNEPADVYVGHTLADTLKLEIGDRVVLTVSPRGGGRARSIALSVRGVFKSGIDELDGFYIEIPIDVAQTLYALGDDVTQVAVLLDNLEDTGPATAALRKKLASTTAADTLEVLPWQTALKELYEAIVLDDGGNYVMMAVIFVIVAIGIFNTVLMSVIERTREFGVMMAIGTSERLMFAMVMVEAAILAVVAALAGLLVGLGGHLYFATYGLDLTELYGDGLEMAGIVFEGRMYSALSVPVVAQWTLLVVAIVLVSAVYPAFRATRLDPVEAMRHA
jgi:ABC-type lipoprotein release transport system permease subunit